MTSAPPIRRGVGLGLARVGLAVLVAAGLVLASPSVALCDPPTPAERKAAGDQAMEALRYEDALKAYSEAYEATKDPALLYNMGRALQALNRFPEALDKLEAFQAQAGKDLLARVPRLPALIAEIKQRVTTLTVTTVEGARVIVRGTVLGTSPLGPQRLVAGPADVDVEKEGYFPFQKRVDLPGGGALAIEAPLASRSTSGVLTVKASATGAEVQVDGKRVGVAPVETTVAAGSHRIVVRHKDHSDFETSAVVPAGGSKEVNASLASPSIVSRWWFWGGVGVVVAAGAAITIAALTERPADTGTIPPGQLKAPNANPALIRF